MEEALVALLLANPGLAALVSNRITWLDRPQASDLPAITLQVAAGNPEYTQVGRIKLTGRIVQFDVWAGSYGAAKLVERALLAALDGLKVNGFQGAFVTGQRDGSEAQGAPDIAGSTTFYRSSIDARIWHAAAL